MLRKLVTAATDGSWASLKRFFPGVTEPLFHATTGPRGARIALYGEGIKAQSGHSNFGGQPGVSLSRNLSFLIGGNFGNVIFVLDRADLRRFKVSPLQHPSVGDEYEERLQTPHVPVSMIRGVIVKQRMLRDNAQEWLDSVNFPVVGQRSDGSFAMASDLAVRPAAKTASTDDLYVFGRGWVRFPDGKTHKISRLGKGMFSTAYLMPDNTVLILSHERNGAQDFAKEVPWLARTYGSSNKHIPHVEKLGWTGDGSTVYSMPKYEAPLTKGGAPKAWAQYLAVRKHWQAAIAKERASNFYGRVFGYKLRTTFLEAMQDDPKIDGDLYHALEALSNTADDFGESVMSEFSPRNLASDDDGNLILLDIVFDPGMVSRMLSRR